jgi:hypothetical protein
MSVKTGWIIGGAIIALLVILSYVYAGNGQHPAYIPTQTQPQG